MNLVSFLVRSSWKKLAIAIVAGFLSGCSSAALIALISRTVGGRFDVPHPSVAWGFAGLACLALSTSILARIMLVRLSQDAVFQLQMRLSRQILASELTHLELLGSARLLATLTEDIQAISNAVFVIPPLSINLAIVLGCMVYITWLSWKVLLIVLGLSLAAGWSCNILLQQGRRRLAFAREEQDSLFKKLSHYYRGSERTQVTLLAASSLSHR